jgi:hypothetical protein
LDRAKEINVIGFLNEGSTFVIRVASMNALLYSKNLENKKEGEQSLKTKLIVFSCKQCRAIEEVFMAYLPS